LTQPEPSVRAAEVLLAFAHAGDLGSGQPVGHVMRTGLLALRLAEELGLPEAQRRSVYETALLVHGGCTAGSALFASFVACDELVAMREMCLCDPDSVVEVLGWVRKNVALGAPLPARVQRVMQFLAQAEPVMGDIERGCADVGARIAERLGSPADAVRALGVVCERWNGKGPRKSKGAAIALPARVVHAAMVLEIFAHERGRDAAIATARARRGRSLDPTVVDAFLSIATASSLWDDLDGDDTALADRVLEREPGGPRVLAGVDDVALAIADFADLKAHGTAAHSRATASLAYDVAVHVGLVAAECVLARRAALVHDVGMVGVPSFVLHKPAPSAAERAQIAMHVHWGQRLLARIPALAPIAAVAAAHHERGDAIAPPARALAVADVYDEAVRHGAAPEAALAAVRADAGLDRAYVDALADVLARGSSGAATSRPANEAGLSDRELEVLVLVARGRTVKDSARELELSVHTVRHHLEHVYAKIGVTSRAAAVLYAVERGLLR
jgi:HD-GYP domain-containing protein (c-di-GMP phosphodiesterase class II)